MVSKVAAAVGVHARACVLAYANLDIGSFVMAGYGTSQARGMRKGNPLMLGLAEPGT